jgi:hypothetical protein
MVVVHQANSLATLGRAHCRSDSSWAGPYDKNIEFLARAVIHQFSHPFPLRTRFDSFDNVLCH